MTKKSKTQSKSVQFKPVIQWRGSLRLDSPYLHTLAEQMVQELDPSELPRFTQKMWYWTQNSAQNPVQFAISPRQAHMIQRGRSRFLAHLLLAKPLTAEVQAFQPELCKDILADIMPRAKQVKLRNFRIERSEYRVRGFEQALERAPCIELDPTLRGLEQWRDFLDRARSANG